MSTIFSPVFPTSTFVITCLEIFLFGIAVLQYLMDRDKSNLRFMVLTVFFIQYNLINGFLPDWNYNWFGNLFYSVFFQNIMGYSAGIALASYYFYYLTVELDIRVDKTFSVKFLIISLVCSFLLFYCTTYIIFRQEDIARLAFLPFPSIIALFFAYNTVRFILKNGIKRDYNLYQRIRSFSGYVGIIFMASMPIILWWGDQNKGWNHLLVNTSFALSFYSHMLQFLKHNKRFTPESIIPLSDKKYHKLKLLLTKREIEILALVGQGKSNKDIGRLMFISDATVRKHLSNMYPKAGVKGINELLEEYPNIDKYFYE